MRKILLLAIVMYSGALSAQRADTAWTTGSVLGMNFSNTSFSSYWQAGGVNAISMGSLVNLFANYKAGKIDWQNNADLAFGMVKQNGRPLVKADDRIELSSKLGTKMSEKLLAAASANFRTQFAPGGPINAEGRIAPVRSRFLAPGFFNIGVGVDYQPAKDFSIYYAPLNGKVTIVGVDSLRRFYMPPSVTSSTRFELGSFLNVKLRRELMKNVTFQTKADFFANYLQNFGNVDVNWENLIALQVNKYITTTFFTHLIYDDDIRFDIIKDGVPTGGNGPRTQFKHVLNVGFIYKMGDARK